MKNKILFTTLIFILMISCAPKAEITPPVVVQETSAPTLEPTALDTETSTATLIVPTDTATPRPTLAPDAWMQLLVVPESISPKMLEVYKKGLALGNDPKKFAVIGDCQNVSSYFLSVFEKPDEFSLGEKYNYLQPTIDYYQGSYSHVSAAVQGGFNVAAILSPLRADPKICNPNESPLDCELRLWNPSVVIVSMETWWSDNPAEIYSSYMRQIIEQLLTKGIVPILATKADNLEGDNSINAAIAQIAYEYEIPLWNFWAATYPLPSHGLSPDGFHLTFARNFFDDPSRMRTAWPWRNLTALQVLDAVRKGLTENK